MKRDAKQKLFALTSEEMKKKISELAMEILQARQERMLQDKKAVDVKRSYKLRKQVTMLKTELRRRELENV